MKKIILTILTTITILGVNAQGNNLQFNRALFETIVSGIPDNFGKVSISNSFNVPAGKTWKITNFAPGAGTLSGPGAAGVKGLYISKTGQDNFASYPIYNSGNNNSDIPPGHMSYPIWLPAGNYDIVFEVPNNINYYSPIYIIATGIEFNIIP